MLEVGATGTKTGLHWANSAYQSPLNEAGGIFCLELCDVINKTAMTSSLPLSLSYISNREDESPSATFVGSNVPVNGQITELT
jgi:hypothetical protein